MRATEVMTPDGRAPISFAAGTHAREPPDGGPFLLAVERADFAGLSHLAPQSVCVCVCGEVLQ